MKPTTQQPDQAALVLGTHSYFGIRKINAVPQKIPETNKLNEVNSQRIHNKYTTLIAFSHVCNDYGYNY